MSQEGTFYYCLSQKLLSVVKTKFECHLLNFFKFSAWVVTKELPISSSKSLNSNLPFNVKMHRNQTSKKLNTEEFAMCSPVPESLFQ